jgi:hypothetical protein
LGSICIWGVRREIILPEYRTLNVKILPSMYIKVTLYDENTYLYIEGLDICQLSFAASL